jgi:hypothetical protein
VTVSTYEDAVTGIDAKLEKLGPEIPVAPKAEKMAELISTLCNRDRTTVKHLLMLLEPFTYSLIFELCALVSFSFAFGHKPQQCATSTATPEIPAISPANWHQHELGAPSVSTIAAPCVAPVSEPQPQHSNVVAFPQHGSSDALGTSNREMADALGLEKTLFFRACAALHAGGAVDVMVQKNRGTRLVLKQLACH